MKAHRKAKTLKCQATEAVAMLPVLTAFASRVALPASTCPRQRLACIVLVRLLNVVQLVLGAQLPISNVEAYAAEVDAAAEAFLNAFRSTFAVKFMVTKFHALLHFGDQIRRWGTLLSCWVHERKHIFVRDFCNTIKNTREFERSVLGNVVCQTLHNLCSPEALKYPLGLVKPRAAPLGLAQRVFEDLEINGPPNVHYAQSLRFNAWTACAVGDVVLVTLGGAGALQAGWVWKHVAVPTVGADAGADDGYACLHISLVQLGTVNEHDAEVGIASWTLQEHPEWVDCNDIVDVCVFSWETSRRIRTLLPRRFRNLYT